VGGDVASSLPRRKRQKERERERERERRRKREGSRFYSRPVGKRRSGTSSVVGRARVPTINSPSVSSVIVLIVARFRRPRHVITNSRDGIVVSFVCGEDGGRPAIIGSDGALFLLLLPINVSKCVRACVHPAVREFSSHARAASHDCRSTKNRPTESARFRPSPARRSISRRDRGNVRIGRGPTHFAEI